MVGRILRQHHHAAHAGRTGGERIPLRFLVGEGGQQSPVDAGVDLGSLEHRPVLRQRGAYALDETQAVGRAQALHVAKIAVDQACQRTVVAATFDEGFCLVQQHRVGVGGK